MSTNKNDANKLLVLTALQGVRESLRSAPDDPSVARALDQCDRLEVAISQFHAEGLRFAAFTLLKMVNTHGTPFTEPVRSATQNLQNALVMAGFPH